MSPISSIVDKIQNKVGELGAKRRVESITPTTFSWNDQNKLKWCAAIATTDF